jgi:transposase
MTRRSTALTSEPSKGAHTGPSPVDRARPGSKHHLITDQHGTPLAVSLTSGNRHDVTQLIPWLDAIPRIRGVRGRPRRRPARLFADRAYDFDKYRRLLRALGITPNIARCGAPHGSGPGKTRWVVE